jgi:hypothetical protein
VVTVPGIGGDPAFRDDLGPADPRVAAALAAFAAGHGSERAVLVALAGSRLLVPVIAGPPGHHAPLAAPMLTGLDGRLALPAFTCLDTLRQWRTDARPVPVAAAEVWRSAAAESCSVVIDLAGPVPLAVEGARLAALARGEAPPPPCGDPDVRAAVAAALADQPEVSGFALAGGQSGTDLTVLLTLAGGHAAPSASTASRQAAAAIMALLPDRLRRGIAVTVARS